MRPTKGLGRAEYKTRANWLHVDTDGFKAPAESGYQAAVNISGQDDAREGQPGLRQGADRPCLGHSSGRTFG
jgi:hypothetical protein